MPTRSTLFAALASVVALAASAGDRIVTTPDLLRRMAGPTDRWAFTLVDARTAVEFAEAHIPGAVNVPASATARRLPEVVKDKSRTVIFYCNGPNCTKSGKAAKAAVAAGYTDVWEYREGLPGWSRARQPMEGSPLPNYEAATVPPAALEGLLAGAAPPVVVDIRDTAEFESHRLRGSIGIPIDEIRARVREIPAGREIVVADHAGHQAPVAARLLASLGRTPVRRLDGGILRWQEAGLPVEKK